jgi:hypothetical protein
MNESAHNFLNHLKSSSNTDTSGWPVSQTVVRGTPESNREIIDLTRDKKRRALMDKDANNKPQLYLQDHGPLKEWDIISIYQDGRVEVQPFI